MEPTRRGFLQLLGLGGAAAATGMLFSPGHSDLLIGGADKYVFETPPLLKPSARATFMDFSGESESASPMTLRNPSRGLWAPSGEACVYQVDCPVAASEDPHISFFMAATELQRKINDDVQRFSSVARGLVVLTMVDVPIMAFPHPEKGFYLETQLRQYCAQSEDIHNRDKAVSKRGEVPIEVPDNISFKYLMLMQEELKGMGMITPHNLHSAAKEARRRVGRLTLS